MKESLNNDVNINPTLPFIVSFYDLGDTFSDI